MSIARILINIYRSVQYAICGREKKGILNPGTACSVEPFKYDINHGDIVHPCVRYIPEGYEGHCWWLVYTPYYGADPGMENPILCYAENDTLTPPTEWKVYCEVKGKPQKGYNSDPVLLYSNRKMYVFWREYGTESVEATGHEVATFGGVVKDGKVVNEFGPVVWADDMEIDAEVSPTFLQKEGHFICFAMHLKFHSKWIKKQKPGLKKILLKVVGLADLLGIGSQQKSYGVAIWESNSVESPFKYVDTLKFQNCNALYRPWHMDFFEYQNRLFAIVQTNQCNADVCLAYSNDYKHFTFFDKPLITNSTINKLGIYKPTAGVIGDLFYLYYTAQDPNNRALNKLYMTRLDIKELLAIEKS